MRKTILVSRLGIAALFVVGMLATVWSNVRSDRVPALPSFDDDVGADGSPYGTSDGACAYVATPGRHP